MGKIADALKLLIDNSEDLSTLPQIVAQVTELETTEEGYQKRIADLQDVNRKYLAQIPVPGKNEPNEPETNEPTLEDAKAYLVEKLKGDF